MRLVVSALLLASACGRLNFAPLGRALGDDDGDGGTSGDGLNARFDGGVDPLGPWGTPVQMTVLGIAGRGDGTPTLTEDLLEIYFSSNRNSPSTSDLFMATRASASAAWNAPVELTALSSPQSEYSAEVSPDGLTLWFASNRSGSASCDIYVSRRSARGAAWGPASIETSLSTSGCEGEPALADDELAMALSGGTNGDLLYIATRATTSGAFSPAVPLTELNNAPYGQYAGALRDGERELFFDHCLDITTCQIYVATRATPSDPFGTPVPVDTVNVGVLNSDAWVSRDRHTMYFASDATGDMEIYETKR